MRILIVFISFFSFLRIEGQINNYYNFGKAGTVQFFRQGYPLSFPAVDLNSSDKLELRFDVFTSKPEDLFYSVELCDYNWLPVDIDPTNYLEGFNLNTFEAYSRSINTTVDYIHYRLILPNDDIIITEGGNYVVGIFRDREKLDTVLIQRFVVYEEIISVELAIDKFKSELLVDKQELNAVLNLGALTLNDLSGNLKLSVLQDNNWNTIKTFEKYSGNAKGGIAFNLPGQIVFNGRNEFRTFDMKSLKHYSERVKYVDYIAPDYHVYLKPDKLRGDKDYFFREDLNGVFYIDNTDTDDEDIIDAEYVKVHFCLETGYPLPADVYIDGALTGWEFTENYMDFNSETGNYEKTLFLKQGLYNYRYILKEYNSKEITTDITEGDFYQTVNNYIGIVYHRALGELFYKPVGITSFTTN
jgi:hypothetical protein